MKWIKAVRGLMLFLFCVSFVSTVFADDFFSGRSDDYVKSRSYIGGVGISSNIDQWGDFNGLNSLQFGPVTTVGGATTTYSNPEIDLIPAITRNFGWGALAGHREGPWAAEISFWRSEHTANYTGGGPITISSPSSLQSINFDFKRYLLTQLPTQPFLSVGFSVPWLWVRQGSYLFDPSLTTQLSNNDETISGFGLMLGVGLEIYLDQNFSILGGACRRWTSFDQVTGAARIPLNEIYFDGVPKDVGSLAGDAYNFYVGTTFGFE